MNNTPESISGRITLALGHVGGMLDLIILPLWVGGMISTFAFAPQQAGIVVGLFLIGVLLSNSILARRYGRIPNRPVAGIGFSVMCLAFFAMTRVPFMSGLGTLSQIAALHFVAGLGAGVGLSCVHGTIGRSANPHRMFATANLAIAISAVIFYAITPTLMMSLGVNAVFYFVCVVSGAAALSSFIAHPTLLAPVPTALPTRSGPRPASALGGLLVLGFAGVVLMQTGNSMSASFVERIGDFRQFDKGAVGGMLAAAGLLNILAPLSAALLQKRLNPIHVAVGALAIHGLSSIVISNSPTFLPYAIAFAVMVFVVIFAHTYIFGLLAHLDPSGRTNASTPTMLMMGTAIGPVVGGFVVQNLGYSSVGFVASAAAWCGAICFVVLGIRKQSTERTAAAIEG